MLPEKKPKRVYATKGYIVILSRYPQTYTTPIKPAQVCSGREMWETMRNGRKSEWENLIVDPAQVMKTLEPGMSIFLGTGVSEPRTLVKHLMSDDSAHLKDLELHLQ
jgi:hypothetical protein